MPAASPDLSVNRPAPDRQYCRAGGLGKTKANVVVAVVGVVPVPVRRAQVSGLLFQEPPRITRWPSLGPLPF